MSPLCHTFLLLLLNPILTAGEKNKTPPVRQRFFSFSPMSTNNQLTADSDMPNVYNIIMGSMGAETSDSMTTSKEILKAFHNFDTKAFLANPPEFTKDEKLLLGIYTKLFKRYLKDVNGIKAFNQIYECPTMNNQCAYNSFTKTDFYMNLPSLVVYNKVNPNAQITPQKLLNDLTAWLKYEKQKQMISKVVTKISSSEPINQKGQASSDLIKGYTQARLKPLSTLSSTIEAIDSKLLNDEATPSAGLDERCNEYLIALSQLAKKRNVPLKDALAPLLKKLIKNREIADLNNNQGYKDWNALLFREGLQALVEESPEEALNYMKKYISVISPVVPADSKNYEDLLKLIYQRTNPIMLFDGDDENSNRRKLFALDLIAYSHPEKKSMILSPEDLTKVANSFEKLIRLNPAVLDSKNIAPSMFSLPKDFEGALQQQSFLPFADKFLNNINLFRLRTSPSNLAEPLYALEFDKFLDSRVEEPNSPLSVPDYTAMKIMNARQNLADTDAIIRLKRPSSNDEKTLESKTEGKGFEEVKHGLIVTYAEKNPLRQKNLEDKDYIKAISEEAFPAKILKKDYIVLPDKQKGVKKQGRNVVNVVVGELPEDVIKFLANEMDVEGKLLEGVYGPNSEGVYDYHFGVATKRLGNPCTENK